MSSAHSLSVRHPRHGLRHGALLAGVSLLALLMAAPQASARPFGAAPLAAQGVADPGQASAAAAEAAARAQAAMKRATDAVQGLQAMQAAARAAAGNPSAIPNGLRPGGLQQATGADAAWIGARAPNERIAGDRTKVEIEQTQPNAILTWQTFNVGAKTDLRFNQQGRADWIALNRVLDPSQRPSQILGTITSDGTVLVINSNGIIFGAGAQINVGSLIASTLDVGQRIAQIKSNSSDYTDVAWRNDTFLKKGIVSYDAQTMVLGAFSTIGAAANTGAITVAPGASITTKGDGGLVLLAAPHVANGGAISAPTGQVILAATNSALYLTPSSGGAADIVSPGTPHGASTTPNIRGLVAAVELDPSASGVTVWNQSSGLIQADRGNITLVSPGASSDIPIGGATYNDGILASTTSVSRNGSIFMDGADVRLGASSLLAILPDRGGETIPQDPTSLAAFKPSAIRIGGVANLIEMQSNALLLAPGADVKFGVTDIGARGFGPRTISIRSGAEINVAGLTGVEVPVSQLQIVIDPAKKNELRDSPLYRDGFLNGATIYLDPRRSGVRADGVAWIGSPLIDATAYYQLTGLSADRLMTKGGNVLLNAPKTYLWAGSVIDMSGGWTHYQAGTIRTTQLVDQFGRIVDIGDADPNAVYVGIAGGFTRNHAHWGVIETWFDPRSSGSRYVEAFTEGRDAGAMTVSASALVLDPIVLADSYAGSRQRADSKAGTAVSSVTGDLRALQSSSTQLPAGGALIVNAQANLVIAPSKPALPDGSGDGWTRGSIATDTGAYTAPTPTAALTTGPGPVIPDSRTDTLVLTDGFLSNSGFSQVSIGLGTGAASDTLFRATTATIVSGASVALNAGGVFTLNAGRIVMDGTVTAPSGKITLQGIDTFVNGTLSVAGLWVNDFNTPLGTVQSHAWLNGGSIAITAFAGVDITSDGQLSTARAHDVSGSILIDRGAHLNLSGGGRIDRKGTVDVSAKGGNLSLKSDVHYYSTTTTGLRIPSIDNAGNPRLAINPDAINARIVIAPEAIQAQGFGGGGTFTLVTPEFAFGSGVPTTGTVLPLDFFSKAGFASYDITSTRTEFSPSTFANGLGGTNALLAVQTLTVGAGQTLALVQSTLPSVLSAGQRTALGALATGGDVRTVLSPSVPADAWDQKAVNLRFGGALELHVAQGGSVTGAAGAALTVGGLLNEGAIRIAGGSITQELILPRNYASGLPGQGNAIGIRTLSDVFTINPDGSIDPNAPSRYTNAAGQPISNQDLAGNFAASPGGVLGRAIYKLGLLDQDQGIVLAPGSVTDLSGAVILNPRQSGPVPLTTGVIVGGGQIVALPAQVQGSSITSPFRMGGMIVAQPGAVIDVSGVAGTFDLPASFGSRSRSGTVPTPVWSDAGAILAGAGGVFTGAVIRAMGGSAQARGGTLQVLNPVLTQHDPLTPAANVYSADMLARSGFDTFVALGNLTTQGDVTLSLGRAFFLQPKTFDGLGSASAAALAPVISSSGALNIEAPYVGLQNYFDLIAPAVSGTPGAGTVTFRARQIDVTGAALFDRSVAKVTLEASGDIRLIGVVPWTSTISGSTADTPSLRGMIAVNGDLSIIAAQIYPTTGTSFAITSTAADGTITIGRSSGALPATPYSAGGNLTIQAANIVQGGVIRVPFGKLSLGSNTPLTATLNNVVTTFAPATKSVVLTDGSITSVSANGLSIPYGTTTDTLEWYFAPTGNDPLTAPPSKVLAISANSITLAGGATVDLSGGGDVYAYEFVPGTGGSRDVLSQFNNDPYSANKINGTGYQYPDGRQVYAIVPSLSAAPAAAYDPIYSANYANLSAAGGVGSRVYLAGGNGLAAGWYTLLPAQYALLPGGMRVVEQAGAKNVVPGLSVVQADGSMLNAGYYGDALSGGSQSQLRLFSIQPQATIRASSNIVLTSGNDYARGKAASNNSALAPIGPDAGRLVLNPLAAMTIDAAVLTAAAPGGRGARVDISGSNIDILSTLAGAPADGAVQLTTAGLNRLNAESLLIGGTRTDNADGTTSLAVISSSILVANDADHPLMAPEIVLVVDDGVTGNVASRLTLNDGATLIATGTMSDRRSGAYVIDGRVTSTVDNGTTTFINPAQSAIGALIRVANGPQRLVQRLRTEASPPNPGSPAGLAATLALGNVSLRGDAISLDTANNVAIASSARLLARDIALGASAIAFTGGSAAAGTVVITPQLQAVLSQGERLTLRSQSSIAFDDGAYAFGDVSFDAATLEARQGGTVSIAAARLQLSNAGAAGTAAGGGGTLAITADEVSIGTGAIASAGFGAVNIAAAGGLFSTAPSGVVDVGSADLVVVTPYMGDRAQASVAGVAPTSSTGMTLRTTGAVVVTNAGTKALDPAALPGIPGSSLTIEGHGVAIAGTHLRATAGTLTVRSSAGLSLSNGAVLEAPGYVKTFGDAADPHTASAPGGTLSLSALGTQGIALGDAVLSVGSGIGNGGALKLSAVNGAIDWGSAVLSGNGGAGGQGGTFALDVNGAIDLVAMNDRVVANGFTGGFELRTRSGDIVLGAGQVLKSGRINLTADGGVVTIGGTIDTSGTQGGSIELYGRSGVSLLSTARLDSHAEGYARDDTRKASAGDITLGTDFVSSTINADGSVTGTGGVISVAAGAVIDASASRPGDRLVRIIRNGVVNYAYVEGDQGGVVRFRAPVVNGNDMNVSVASAGSVRGARAVELEGFKRWDLATVAASGLYTGVTQDSSTNTVTLDLRPGLDGANPDGSTAVVAGLNFLGDNGVGTVVQFVQGFDVSAAYGKLGGLASQSNFQARPGLDLTFSGNITLASNWNLGAGTVNVTAATAAGLMAVDATTGQAYVKVGSEAALLENYTTMLYRVGGRVTGAAPIVSLRAGGDLRLSGSLTDGFFQFRDQYDATYQSYLNAKASNFTLALTAPGLSAGSDGSSNVDWATWVNDASPWDNYYYRIIDSLDYNFTYIDELQGQPGAGGRVVPAIPFSAFGNSAAALGTGAGGAGDPLASAVVFPLLSGGRFVTSSDYRLTAGAATTSVDPQRIALASTGNLLVDIAQPRSMTVTAASAGGSFSVEIYDSMFQLADTPFVAGQAGFENYLRNIFPNLSDDAAITMPYRNAVPASLQTFIDATLAADPSAHVKAWSNNYYNEVTISVALLARYLEQNPGGFGGGGSGGSNITINLLPQNMVRTGTGSIRMAAAGNVDLTGGSAITYVKSDGSVGPGGNQLGGASVYTAGHPAAPVTQVLPDPIDPTRLVTVTPPTPAASVFVNPPDYHYGAVGVGIAGSAGVVLADALTLSGGGNITLSAQGSVLGRGDLALRTILGPSSSDRPWRIGSVTPDATTAAINPQLCRAGVGALGGGSVRIDAGGAISDILAVADTSLVTAVAAPAGQGSTRVLLSSGGGDVVLRAGGDIVAARIEAASGQVALSAAGRIGALPGAETQVRIDDATVSLAAGADITIRGISQLDGYYSDRSAFNLVANGAITITNTLPGGAFGTNYAIYPGTFTVASLLGDANLRAYAVPATFAGAVPPAAYNADAPKGILMVPVATGQLSILAGGSIAPTSIAMLDGDPNLLPGLFTLGGSVIINASGIVNVGGNAQYQFTFPAVLSTTQQGQREQLHLPGGTHADDPAPVIISAGGDIGTADSGVRLFLPKQTRITAGRDILNMMFFGQNLAAADITRIVAGRDLIGTTQLGQSGLSGLTKPVLLGNSFILGGPGDLMVEAGRNMGPFLNSAVIKSLVDAGGLLVNGRPLTFGEGIVTVGNEWNPYLPAQGADITVLFGTAKGADYDALREAYVAPGTAAHALGGYGTKLIAWMKTNAAEVLTARFGNGDISEQQAYDAFLSLSPLRQRLFLINDVYFAELRAPAVKDGPSYLKYSRGYLAVNTLFPARLGYTPNSLDGGASDGAIVHTGDLDLRLAAIETVRGGSINILGPGGRVLAGSVVSTAQQALRRNYIGYPLFAAAGVDNFLQRISPIDAIPTGYEGIISLRGGGINTFTDGDILLNQSRLFTVKGGDITMWSSNADLNAGQGAKTTPNFPPAVVRIGKNLFVEPDQAGATTGAGIAALPPDVGTEPPDVYLLAPRGTVDAGDAGVRSAGNLSVAALRIANADNFKVGGTSTGLPIYQGPTTLALTDTSNSSAAALKQAEPKQDTGSDQPSVILVEFLGFGGGSSEDPAERDKAKDRDKQSSIQYDPDNVVRILGNGRFTAADVQQLTDGEREAVSRQIVSPGLH